MGLFLGAFGGLVFALWELVFLARVGLPVPTDELLLRSLTAYAIVGAVFGIVAGFRGLSRARWALVTVASSGAWLVSGKVGMAMSTLGLPLWTGLLLVPLVLAMTMSLVELQFSNRLLQFVATAGFVALALGLPVNLHLLPQPLAPIALLVDGVVVALALLAGFVGARFGRQGNGLLLTLAAALGLLAGWSGTQERSQDRILPAREVGPPIVLVVIDTLRADHLGAWGYARDTSPHLDQLARRGIRFDDAWSVAPWTLPSTASILTGQYPYRHGAGVNPGQGNLRSPIQPSAPRVPGLLRERGYATAAVVTNPWLISAYGFEQGFDRYDDRVSPASVPVVLHPFEVFAPGRVDWPIYRDASQITDEAVGWIASRGRGSWFLMVHYMDVHGPHRPAPEDVRALGRGSAGRLIDAYDASIRTVDRQVGRLLEALPSDAWVVVVADHGEELGEHRTVGPGVPEGTRHGHTLFQEQLHVPLIVWGPRVGGRLVRRPVSTLDVAPTLLSLAGVPVPEAMQGRPLPEVVGTGETGEVLLYAEALRFGPEQRAGRRGYYKVLSRQEAEPWLFDLEADPLETTPVLLTANPEAGTVLRGVMSEMPRVGRVSFLEPVPLGFEMRRLLERLGYAEPEEPRDALRK